MSMISSRRLPGGETMFSTRLTGLGKMSREERGGRREEEEAMPAEEER
jgi:hypothetical protein